MDPAAHLAATGVSNDLILENARKIHRDLRIPMRIRVPVIPGANDSIENIEATARFVCEDLGGAAPVHLIPYHRFGVSKYQLLEIDSGSETAPPTPERMEELRARIASFGLETVMGG